MGSELALPGGDVLGAQGSARLSSGGADWASPARGQRPDPQEPRPKTDTTSSQSLPRSLCLLRHTAHVVA